MVVGTGGVDVLLLILPPLYLHLLMSSAVLAIACVHYQHRSGNSGPIPAVVHGPSKRGLEYLNSVVQEICWSGCLDTWNHTPHFPYFVTHFVDSMPIASIGGILSDVMFNPNYAQNVFKVTVAIDCLGNMVWI